MFDSEVAAAQAYDEYAAPLNRPVNFPECLLQGAAPFSASSASSSTEGDKAPSFHLEAMRHSNALSVETMAKKRQRSETEALAASKSLSSRKTSSLSLVESKLASGSISDSALLALLVRRRETLQMSIAALDSGAWSEHWVPTLLPLMSDRPELAEAPKRGGSSIYAGVSYDSRNKKWVSEYSSRKL